MTDTLEIEELLPKIRSALSRTLATETGQGVGVTDSVEAFISLTARNVMASLADLVTLSRGLKGEQVASHSCQVMNCARGLQLRAAIRETIDVLEQTKSAFKSKTLANLRQKLELVLSEK